MKFSLPLLHKVNKTALVLGFSILCCGIVRWSFAANYNVDSQGVGFVFELSPGNRVKIITIGPTIHEPIAYLGQGLTSVEQYRTIITGPYGWVGNTYYSSQSRKFNYQRYVLDNGNYFPGYFTYDYQFIAIATTTDPITPVSPCPDPVTLAAFLATCPSGMGSYDCATQTGECAVTPCSNTIDADGDGFTQCEDCDDGDNTKTTQCISSDKSDRQQGYGDPCSKKQGGQGR